MPPCGYATATEPTWGSKPGPPSMYVNHGGTRDTHPPEFGVGTLIQMVPTFYHVTNFKNGRMHGMWLPSPRLGSTEPLLDPNIDNVDARGVTVVIETGVKDLAASAISEARLNSVAVTVCHASW